MQTNSIHECTTRFGEADLILNKDGSVYHLNLKPGNVSDTIILVGDPGRVHKVSQYFDEVEFEMNQREFITHTGKYKGKKITVMSTGMGVANLEIVLIELDALFNINLKKREPKADIHQLNLIRIGTSGGLREDLALGSQVVNNYAIGMSTLMNFYQLEQSDFEINVSQSLKSHLGLNFTPFCVKANEELKEKLAFDMIEGNTMTTPGFYAPQGRVTRIPKRYDNLVNELIYFHVDDFWITNFEMETAALYGMSRLLGHKALSINTILANRAKNTFSKNPYKQIEYLIKKVLERI